MGSESVGAPVATTQPRAALDTSPSETRSPPSSATETNLVTGSKPSPTMSAAAVELGAPVPLERSSRVEEIEEKEVEDLTEIVDNMKIAETAPDPEKVMKHPLQNAWTLWFFKNDKTRSWEENQRPIITVTTVEDFWSLYNHIEVASRLPRETSWLCGSLTPASRRHHQDRQDDQGE